MRNGVMHNLLTSISTPLGINKTFQKFKSTFIIPCALCCSIFPILGCFSKPVMLKGVITLMSKCVFGTESKMKSVFQWLV